MSTSATSRPPVEGPPALGVVTVVTGAPQHDASREAVHQALLVLEDQPGYAVASEAEVAELAASATALGDPELLWRTRLLDAALMGRRGELPGTIKALESVHHYASEHDAHDLLARTHCVLAWTYRDVGDLATCLEHAVKAVELLDDDAPPGVRALHLIRLADALDECGSPEQARVQYEAAEEVAARSGHVARLVSCLNNRAYGEYLRGDLAAAERTINRLLEVSLVHDAPMRANTLDTLARIQVALGRHDQAIATIERAFEAYEALGVREAMSPAEFLLTRVVAQRSAGYLDAAQLSLQECASHAERAGLTSVLARVEQERAELHAARGDFEQAFGAFKAFHAAAAQLISEQRAARSRLQQAVLETNEIRAEADRLQRLDSYRTEMIATISHELKNPLTAVTGHLELMASLPDLPPDGERSMAAMHRGAERIRALVESLLELARLEGCEPPRRELVDLDAVVVEAVAQLEVEIMGAGIAVDHRRVPRPALVEGDHDELACAVGNLVGNAVKYSDPGGTVTLTVRHHGGHVVLSCRDGGIGISDDDQRRLFTEFFRSKDPVALARPGTGLGLAIVRRIAVRHRGDVRVTSTPGVGSCFELHLPAAPAGST